MLFDLDIKETAQLVTVGASDNTWTFSIEDLNNHSAAWFVQTILGRPASEML
jgi:hypothetical protein